MQELKEAINQAHSVLVVVPKEGSDRDYFAALQLKSFAPEKTTILAPEDKEIAWQDTFGIVPEKKEFAITIDLTRSPVDELRYEKEEGKITVILSHRRSFDPQGISLSARLPEADLIISVGFSSTEAAETFIETLPHKNPARHVVFGINGTSHKTLSPIPAPQARLLGRILARSREEDDIGALWSFITKDDFQKTETAPDDIPRLLGAASELTSLPRMFILFWQVPDEDRVAGILWSHDKNLINAVASNVGSAFPQSTYCDLPEFSNFIEAESAIRKLLRSFEYDTMSSWTSHSQTTD